MENTIDKHVNYGFKVMIATIIGLIQNRSGKWPSTVELSIADEIVPILACKIDAKFEIYFLAKLLYMGIEIDEILKRPLECLFVFAIHRHFQRSLKKNQTCFNYLAFCVVGYRRVSSKY